MGNWKITLMAVLLAAFAADITGTASAQQKLTFKIGWTTSDSPQDPYATGAHAFKQAV